MGLTGLGNFYNFPPPFRIKKEARLIISKENPLTFEHLSRTTCCVATSFQIAPYVPIDGNF